MFTKCHCNAMKFHSEINVAEASSASARADMVLDVPSDDMERMGSKNTPAALGERVGEGTSPTVLAGLSPFETDVSLESHHPPLASSLR